jgi:TatD DNase family protein
LSTSPYIDIHTHRFVSVADILTIQNVFASDIHRIDNQKSGFFSVGIHPWYISAEAVGDEISAIEKYLQNPQILAIGEAGLDKLCNVDINLQATVFKLQLELAAKSTKPLIVHCVKSYQEMVSLFQQSTNKPVLIFHGFNQNLQVAGSLIKHGFYVSFGKAILNQKSNAYGLFAQVPVNRFFLETDDSGISIEEIYAQAARIKGISVPELRKMVYNTFENSFKYKS